MSAVLLIYCGVCNKTMPLEDHPRTCHGAIMRCDKKMSGSTRANAKSKTTNKRNVRFGDDIVRHIPGRNQSETQFRKESRR
jgi:hypothetical protein